MRRSLLAAVTVALVAVASPIQAADGDGDNREWSPPRTAWGVPDLRGVWDFRTITPLERPTSLGEKQVFEDSEAAEFRVAELGRRDKDRRPSDGLTVQRDVSYAYNQFWWDYGDQLTEDRRTSLVVRPDNGRIPALKPEAAARYGAMRAARARPAHGPEDRGVAERCILGFNAGPPYTPSAYNNNVHIFQSPGYAVLLIEMVNDARIVPLDGRAHIPENIRQWRGDARGRWEGDTLVVESRNFTDKTSFRGSGPNMVLTERFTRVGPEGLVYEYTVTDSESFEEPWTALIPMKKTGEPMYEYACHEGNYSMFTMLEGARMAEREVRQKAGEASQ